MKRKLSTRQKILLGIAAVCILWFVCRGYIAWSADGIMRTSVPAMAQVTEASAVWLSAEKSVTQNRTGTSVMYFVKAYQDLTVAYPAEGAERQRTLKEIEIFSHSYSCRDEERAKGYARADLGDDDYAYRKGDTVEIYVKKGEPDSIYLADELALDRNLAGWIYLPILAAAALLLLPFGFQYATGFSDGGILAFLIGAFFGGLLCRSLLQRGADYRPALAVLGFLAIVCMAGGIFLICFDQKRKAADIDRERG